MEYQSRKARTWGNFVDSFAPILDRLECTGAKIDKDRSVVMLLGSMNGHFESTVEAIKTLGDERFTWDDVYSRVIEVAKTSQNKRRNVALAGQEMITCDFCGKRGHEASRCWKNPDPHYRLVFSRTLLHQQIDEEINQSFKGMLPTY
jgi:gag-polypeptide of LTR copia-type